MNVSPNGLPIRGVPGDVPKSALSGSSLSHLGEKIEADIKAPFASQKSENSATSTADMQVKVWNSKDGQAADTTSPLRIAQALSHAFHLSLGAPKAPDA